TRDAYRRDVAHFVGWCAAHDLDPTTMRRPQIDAYAATLTHLPNPRTGRPFAPASIARRLAAPSSWYAYLPGAALLDHNPTLRVRRPRIDPQHTPTVGLPADETVAWLRAARADPLLDAACAAALGAFLVAIGARVSEVCGLDVADLGHDSGHRTVRLRM